MLECLIHTTDTFYRDPNLKYYDPAIDRASNMKQGYLQIVRPYGFKWGKLELDPKRFLRVVIEDHWFNPAWLELEYDEKGNEVCDRRVRFPLAKILSLGELETLKSTTYNTKEKLSPIIKPVDLKTIAEVNDWDLQPKTIKLHGSAGDFSIQEDGGGDYTSLKTAVETEASDISTGSTDANFFITESWTNPDTGNWDIDGWTMGSNNMLIQTQGAARSTTGIYDGNTEYRIDNSAQTFDIENNNTTIDGIQCECTSTGIITSAAVTNITIQDSILKVLTGTGTGVIWQHTGGGNSFLKNCIIFKEKEVEAGSEGVLLSSLSNGHVIITNTTISGFDDGIEIDGGTADVVNSAVFNNNNDFDGSFSSIDFCASDDGDGTNAVTITQSASDYAALVTNAPNGDFSPTDAFSELVGGGTATGRPATDIIGVSWVTDDIGAFAFVGGSPILPIKLNLIKGENLGAALYNGSISV